MSSAPTQDLDAKLFRVSADGDCFLVGGRCKACHAVTWGMRSMCPRCWKEGEQEEVAIGRRGVLYSAATVRRAPEGFAVPYMMGVIDLEEGIRVIGRVVGDGGGTWTPNAPVTLQAGVLSTTPEGTEVIGPVFRIVSAEVP